MARQTEAEINAECELALGVALAKYRKATEDLWARYIRAMDAARAEWAQAKLPAWAEFEQTKKQARDECARKLAELGAGE